MRQAILRIKGLLGTNVDAVTAALKGVKGVDRDTVNVCPVNSMAVLNVEDTVTSEELIAAVQHAGCDATVKPALSGVKS